MLTLDKVNTTLLTNNLRSNTTAAAQARQQYDSQRKGPLTSPAADFLFFLPLSTYSNATATIVAQAAAGGPSVSLPSDAPPEVVKGYAAQYKLLNKKLEAKDSAFLEIIWADGDFSLILQHPYSRGSVKASSSNIFDSPIADSGYLRNPVDLALLREGVRFARKLATTPGLTELQLFEVVPGTNVTADADIDNFLRSSVVTLYHPAGSCKIGAKEDGGVVDNNLNVYGVQGLRIVDASVIPILPAAHTMTTVYGIAEKAADIIKGSVAYKAKSKA